MLCRFETEHKTRMMRRESEMQDDALSRFGATGATPYNPKYPFDYLYFLATTKKPAGAQEKEWWREHFVDKVTLVLAGAANLGRFVDDDCPVAADSSEHFATANTTVSWALAAESDARRAPAVPGGKAAAKEIRNLAILDREPPVDPPYKQVDTIKYVNKKKAPLCMAYQTNHCQKAGKGDPSICPKNPSRRHQCHWCLGVHAGSECGLKVIKEKKNKKGQKGGKKGGGKGGRGY